MIEPHPLAPGFVVSSQIDVTDLVRARELGFAAIVNNRPDTEIPSVMAGDKISTAAMDAGLDYHAIPIGAGGFSMEQIKALAEVIKKTEGPILAYCRSGTRSTMLWGLASAYLGQDPQELVGSAASQGYDLSSLLETMSSLAPKNE